MVMTEYVISTCRVARKNYIPESDPVCLVLAQIILSIRTDPTQDDHYLILAHTSCLADTLRLSAMVKITFTASLRCYRWYHYMIP